MSEGGGFWTVGRQSLDGNSGPNGFIGPSRLNASNEAQSREECGEGLHSDALDECVDVGVKEKRVWAI